MYVVKLTTMGNPIITGQLLHWKNDYEKSECELSLTSACVVSLRRGLHSLSAFESDVAIKCHVWSAWHGQFALSAADRRPALSALGAVPLFIAHNVVYALEAVALGLPTDPHTGLLRPDPGARRFEGNSFLIIIYIVFSPLFICLSLNLRITHRPRDALQEISSFKRKSPNGTRTKHFNMFGNEPNLKMDVNIWGFHSQ